MKKSPALPPQVRKATAAFSQYAQTTLELRREAAVYRAALAKALAKGDSRTIRRIAAKKELRKALQRQPAPPPPSVSFFPMTEPFLSSITIPEPQPGRRPPSLPGDPIPYRYKIDIAAFNRMRQHLSYSTICQINKWMTLEDAAYFEEPPIGYAESEYRDGKSLRAVAQSESPPLEPEPVYFSAVRAGFITWFDVETDAAAIVDVTSVVNASIGWIEANPGNSTLLVQANLFQNLAVLSENQLSVVERRSIASASSTDFDENTHGCCSDVGSILQATVERSEGASGPVIVQETIDMSVEVPHGFGSIDAVCTWDPLMVNVRSGCATFPLKLPIETP